MIKYIKILHVGADNIGYGGRSVAAYTLTQNINNQNIHNDFLAFKKIDERYRKKITSKGGNIISVRNNKKNILVRKIYTVIVEINLLKKNHYNGIHIHADNSIEAMKSIILARIAGIKSIYIHAHTSGDCKKHSKLKTIILRICQKLIRNGNYQKIACTAEAASYMFGDFSDDVIILKNGILTENFRFSNKKRLMKRKELKIENKFVIGCVARFSPEKNHFFLLDVFKQLKIINKNAELVLVGNGILMNDVIEYAKFIGVENDVLFLGNRSDVPEILQSLDVFVLASKFEGLGIVNIEAQAAGLPCVVSNGIPLAAKILKDFNFLDLSEGSFIWADAINKYKNFKREDKSLEIIKSNYDVKSSSRTLETLYLKNF